MSALSLKIFACDMVNPPSESCNSDVDLLPTNSRGRISIVKLGVETLQTAYRFEFPESSVIGTSGRPNELVEDFLLACNLATRMAVLTRIEKNLGQIEISRNSENARVEIEKTPTGQNVKVFLTAGISTSVHFTIGFKEELDLDKVLDFLALLRKVNRKTYDRTSTATTTSLGKSLHHYEEAMSSLSRLMIFKNLFNCVELATNCDGTDRSSSRLDAEVASLASISSVNSAEVANWRQFYDRTKHLDSSPRKITDFVEGMGNLPNYLVPVREVANKILKLRLQAI